ncbi:hypothetical protein Tco_1524916 [Tanacetum coccineum]
MVGYQTPSAEEPKNIDREALEGPSGSWVKARHENTRPSRRDYEKWVNEVLECILLVMLKTFNGEIEDSKGMNIRNMCWTEMRSKIDWRTRILAKISIKLVPSCFAIFTFEPLTLSLTSMPSCDLVSLTNILILCLILKASNQSLRKSLSLNLELS